jgi:hypothetical protein
VNIVESINSTLAKGRNCSWTAQLDKTLLRANKAKSSLNQGFSPAKIRTVVAVHPIPETHVTLHIDTAIEVGRQYSLRVFLVQ